MRDTQYNYPHTVDIPSETTTRIFCPTGSVVGSITVVVDTDRYSQVAEQSDWCNANSKHGWSVERVEANGELMEVAVAYTTSGAPLMTLTLPKPSCLIFRFSFEDQADAALFKLFWLEGA